MKIFKNKLTYIIIVFLGLVISMLLFANYVIKDIKGNKSEEKVENIIEKEFENFILYADSSDYQRTLFAELEEYYYTGDVEADKELKYVDIYAKNYIADYVTLGSKKPKVNRVGGKQFLVDALQIHYEELDGVADYYLSRDYYIDSNPKTYKDTLPDVKNLELISSKEQTYDYYDISGKNKEKIGMNAYALTYNIEYNEIANAKQDFQLFDKIKVIVVDWDGVWTVVEVQTNLYQEVPTVIEMK
ncbi:MAG: hypothetical protein ACK5NF_03840 [Bacilli bacterium]